MEDTIVYKKSPVVAAYPSEFYPITARKDYGLYLANRHRNWRKHTRKFKTNNRSSKQF